MLTQERLKEVLDYNPDTGTFLWRASGQGRPLSLEAGGFATGGYIKIGIDGKNYGAHRLAILYTDGYLPEGEVDHRNRIRHDNRRTNLREASRQCQLRNRSMFRNNTSGIRGVSRNKQTGKWLANIRVNGELKTLGRFSSLLEAAYHRYAAEQCLGFTDCDIYSSAKKYIDQMKEAFHE